MNKIINFIIHSRVTTIVVALLCMCIWGYAITNHDMDYREILLVSINILSYLLLGGFINISNKRQSTVTHKSTLASSFFFMSYAINPQLIFCKEGTVLLILILTAQYILSGTYRIHLSMNSYFAAFTLIGIGSLLAPRLLFCIPIIVLSCSLMQSLNIRTFIASFLGTLLPYWISFCIIFLTENTQLIDTFLEELSISAQTSACPSIQLDVFHGTSISMRIIQFIWILLLTIPSITHHILSSTSIVKTRAIRYFQDCILSILLIATFIIPSLYETLQPTIVTFAAIIGTTFYIENMSRSKNIILIMLFLSWLFITGLYLWNIYLTF